MSYTGSGHLGRARHALAAVLPAGARVEAAPDGVVLGGRRLRVCWAGAGTLGDARSAATRTPVPDVVAARELSPGGRELLSSVGIGWVDETGAAEIAIGTILISRTGRARPIAVRDPKWTAGTEAVAEALLLGVRATVSATSEATQLSIGACTKALRALTDFGLLEATAARGRGSARHIPDRRALLDAYVAAVRGRKTHLQLQVGYAARDLDAGIDSLAQRWSGTGTAWALTGAAAASHYADHLTTWGTAEVYVEAQTMAELDAVARASDLKPIPGGRLILRPFPTAVTRLCCQEVGLVRLAPWPRVYVDLLSAGVRGEDAAEHLWEAFNA